MATGRPVDVDALNASFDRIEEGNERARKSAKRTAKGTTRTATVADLPQSSSKPEQDKPAAQPEPEVFSSGSLPSGGSPVETGAGFLLGLVFWGWVAMPFLRGGPAEVKKVLRAKFLNKAPDGSWLP